MASQNENEGQPEDNEWVPQNTQLKIEHSKESQVLETMWNLIVEIHSYKDDNEQLKKYQDNNKKSMRFYCRVYMNEIMEKNNELRVGGTQKGR